MFNFLNRVFFFCLLTFLAVIALAQPSITTESWQTNIAIRKDRVLEVEEIISITFLRPQRGLIRKLPVNVRGASGKVRQVRYENFRATISGSAGSGEVPTRAEVQGGDVSIRIADPNVRRTGANVVVFKYTVLGAMTDFGPDSSVASDEIGPRSELFWNLLPTAWSTPIGQVKGTIAYPDSEGKVTVRIVAGDRGSKDGAQYSSDGNSTGSIDFVRGKFVDRNSFEWSVQRPFEVGQTATAIVAIPFGTLALPSQLERKMMDVRAQPGQSSRPKPPEPNPLFGFIPLLAVPLVFSLIKGQFKPKRAAMVVQYEPPADVSPADAGLLIDEKVDAQDIVSGILSLAQKGHLTMVHSTDSAGGIVLHLIPKKQLKPLTEFEAELLSGLGQYGEEITPEMLRGNFGQTYQSLGNLLERTNSDRGFLNPTSQSSIGCASLLGFAVPIGLSFYFFTYGGIATLVGLVLAIIATLVMIARTTRLTSAGWQMREKLEGLKEFISRAQEKELKYLTKVDPDQALFEQMLPYAVAFGVVDKWTKAFVGIQLQPPDWYDGPYGAQGYWLYSMSNDLNSFGSTWGQAVASPDPSSFDSGSGFGDGGSGFGGGWGDGGGAGDGGGGGGGGGSD